MKPIISVIVAVYNAEKWLCRCLDSLIAQTFMDFEVILIDDGSTDSSGRICDEYAGRDSRFIVIHKANSGVSSTRQVGLERASGEYLIFLDSDDYVHPEAYQRAYDCALRNEADIVCFNYYRIEKTGVHPVYDVHLHYSLKSKLRDILINQNGYLWNHLVSRNLLLRHSIVFPEGMNFGEDQFFFISLLTSCIKNEDTIRFASLKSHLVYYDKTVNPQSLSRMDLERRFWARFHWWESVYKQISLDDRDARPFYRRLVEDVFGAFWNSRVPDQKLCGALAPYRADIKKFAPLSTAKYLVLLISRGEFVKARRLKYIGSPLIIRDKLHQLIASFH